MFPSKHNCDYKQYEFNILIVENSKYQHYEPN